ncbi:MAG: alginate export family protein [Deltaproteobacteria bacterium]|nr:alginate export family protein [Deltaproteobacteria bacterium]
MSLQAQPETPTQKATAPPPAADESREPETFTRPPAPLPAGEQEEVEAPSVTFSKNPISLKYGNGVQAAKSIHFVTSRVRLGLDAQWKFLRVMMQVQDARLFGTRPGFDDGGSFALHQGILEFGNDERGYVRVGRQEINYGNQRMIGALDWLMGARSFDALRFHGFFGDKVEVDAFGAMLARQQNFVVDDTVVPPVTEQNNGAYLATVNAIYKHSAKLRMEAYVLYRHDRPFAAVPAAPRNDIVSPGVFVTGVPVDGLRYTGELTMQGGKQVGLSFFAFAVSGDVEYTSDKPQILRRRRFVWAPKPDRRPPRRRGHDTQVTGGPQARAPATSARRSTPSSSGDLSNGRPCPEVTPCSSPTKAPQTLDTISRRTGPTR